jgi:hypothetical protein
MPNPKQLYNCVKLAKLNTQITKHSHPQYEYLDSWEGIEPLKLVFQIQLTCHIKSN